MNNMEGAEGIRLNKYIAESGVASRRGSDKLIEEGRVTIDGKVAVLGDRVMPGSKVCVDDKLISREEEDIILLFNKPVGITCTSNPDDETNIIDYIGYPKRIYTIGRLDKDSKGLILLTNNGELADRIMRSRNGHEKEYLVSVDKEITPEFVRGMSNGVKIAEDRTTRPCFVEALGEKEFRIILKQGIYRQIRRMCEQFGYTVVSLERIRVMNITLDMREGKYRHISKAERSALYQELGLKE